MSWKLEVGNWRLETGNRKPETGNRKLEKPALSIEHQVSSFKLQVSGFKLQGFTLLELLISMTIIAVIVVLISGSLRVGIKAYEKGEADIEARQRRRIVLDLMKRQIASPCLRNLTYEDDHPLAFKAEEKSLAFMSYISLVPDNRFGMVYVRYVVKTGEEKERLLFYEKNIVMTAEEDADDIDEPAEEEFHELIPSAQSISFEYLNEAEDIAEWQPEWEQKNGKEFPRAIRIVLKETEDSVPVYVIANAVRGPR